MGLGAGKTVNLSTLSPPAFQQPYIDQLLSEARRLYESPGPFMYPESMVAGFTPDQMEAFAILGTNARQAQDLIRPLLVESMRTGLSAPSVEQNPYLGQIADAITQRVNQAVTEQWLPAVRSGAIASGTLGGSRQALSEALIGREASRELSNALASLYGEQYNRGVNTMLNTMQLAPTVQQSMFSPGLMLSAIGEQQRQMNQAKIDEAMQRWAYEQQLPYQKLAEYYNIVSRPFGSTGMSTVTAEGNQGLQVAGGITAMLGWLLDWLRG